jgi:hypothetical protein
MLIICSILEECSCFSGKFVMHGIDVCFQFAYIVASEPANLSSIRDMNRDV